MTDDFLDSLASDTVSGLKESFTHRVAAGEDPTACMQTFLSFLESNIGKNPQLFKKIAARIDFSFFGPLKKVNQITSLSDFVAVYHELVSRLLEIDPQMPYRRDYERQNSLIGEEQRVIRGRLHREKEDKKRIVDDAYAAQLSQARQIYNRARGTPLRRVTSLSFVICAVFLVLLTLSVVMPPSAVKAQTLQPTPVRSQEGLETLSLRPDWSRLAAGMRGRGVRDYPITIWDLTASSRDRTLTAHQESVLSVSFSPDGKKLASGSADGTIILWDMATGSAEKTLEGHEQLVNSVSFSSDGRKLASGSGGSRVIIWDVAIGSEERRLAGHKASVNSVAFSPDDEKLASGSNDRTIILWDMATGSAEKTLEGHTLGVTSVSFNSDGTRLASGSYDGIIIVWEVATGSPEKTLEGHKRRVSAVSFSPDGNLLSSGSHDRTIMIWDVATGRLEKTLRGHKSSVRSVCFSPDGTRLASGSWDATVIIWDLRQADPFGPLAPSQLALMASAFGIVGLGLYAGYRCRISAVQLASRDRAAHDLSLDSIEKHFSDKERFEIAESTLRILTTDDE